MKVFRYSILAFSIIILIASCQKTITIDEVGGYESKIVLNGLLFPDSTSQIHLARSIGILENEYQNVILENALVSITDENNTPIACTYDGIGFYSIEKDVLKVGQKYDFTISNDGYKSISSSVIIPAKPTIVSVNKDIIKTVDPNCVGCSANETLVFDINLETSNTDKEYFIVSLHRVDTTFYDLRFNNKTETYDTIYFDEPIIYEDREWILSHSTNLKIIKDEYSLNEAFNDDYYYSGRELFFEKPAGITKYTIPIRRESFSYYDGHVYYYTVVVAITEEFYKHELSLARAEYAEYDFLAEKVSIYTNVKNGHGILGGASAAIYQFNSEE